MDESEEFSIFDVAAGDLARVVNVAGEVNMGTGPAFQRGLLRAIGASRGGLIVDLSHASFLDSTALTTLVNAFDSCAARAAARSRSWRATRGCARSSRSPAWSA